MLILILCLCSNLMTDNILISTNSILSDDYDYFTKFHRKKVISNLINNNKLEIPMAKKNNILFITFDNRNNDNNSKEYIQIHNYNISSYVNLYNYKYTFYNKCNENVYWCKIYMVLDALKKNIYDYVVWMDSDTVIKNFNIDIGNILNSYSSDIFIGSDNNTEYDITNAGVFIIKNTQIGINFLNDCINMVSDKCINNDGTLKGVWAASCYEQGVMNLLIAEKYYKNTTVLTNQIIFNYNICSDEVFIMHLYASPARYRTRCFLSNNPAI